MSIIGTDIPAAVALLKAGELVAFATETVYGLGANALDPSAVAKVFEAKQRPTFDPLIVHLASREQLPVVATTVPETASQLIDAFWPGPLTLVLPKTDAVPDLVTSGLSSVAVRCPDHPLAIELLNAAGLPLAAPSANRFGGISPTTAQHVQDHLSEQVSYILDGGACRVGIESTVVDVTGETPVVLRPGGITIEQLRNICPDIQMAKSTSNPGGEAQAGPGMLDRHYAPSTPLYITETPAPSMSQRVGLLTFQPLCSCHPFAAVEVLSPNGSLTEAAANLFAAMRRLDAANLHCILATPFPNEGLGIAMNDRLRRAADE